MKQKHIFLLTISAIVVVIMTIILVVYARPNPHPKTHEGFVPTLDTDTMAARYAQNGIEKCAVMDDGSLLAASYVDTLRLRKYKPTAASTASTASPSATQYCYFYRDTDPAKYILEGSGLVQSEDGSTAGPALPNGARKLAAIADPLAAIDATCSKASPAFANTTFITDVFPDSDRDMTVNDTLRYDKCVLKIDPVAATRENVAAFYNGLNAIGGSSSGAPACAGVIDALKAENDRYTDEIARIVREIAATTADTGRLRQEIDNYRRAQNVTPQHQWPQVKADAAACNSALDAAKARLAAETNAYTLSNGKKMAHIAATTASITAANTATATERRNMEGIQGRWKGLDDIKVFYTAQVRKLNGELLGEQQRLATCNRRVAQEKATADRLAADLASRTQHYYDLTQDLKKRREAEEALRKDEAARTKHTNDLAVTIVSVVIEKDQCLARAPFFRDEAARWKTALDAARIKADQCIARTAPVAAELETLEKRVAGLYTEIEEIKKNCRGYEDNFHKNNVDTTRTTATRTLDTVKEQCSAVTVMKQKKADLESELVSLDEQKIMAQQATASCDKVREACCKEVYRKAWENDAGIMDEYKVKTDESDMDSWRYGKSLGGNRLRFKMSNGKLTPYLEWNADDKRQGKNASWIQFGTKILDAKEGNADLKFKEVMMYDITGWWN